MHLSRHIKWSSSLITPCGQVMASVSRTSEIKDELQNNHWYSSSMVR
jgi:hypothetical protein